MKSSKDALKIAFEGIMQYTDNFPGETINRIIIPVTINSTYPTFAMIDTGASYCIINPEEAEGLDIQFEGEEKRTIGGETNRNGKIGRAYITLEASEGGGIQVDAKVWIPELKDGEKWNKPNILGYAGFLELIRFAIDPASNIFYFATV